MGVRKGATDAESDNLGARVHVLELLQERDRATLAISSCWLVEESLTSGLDSLSEPSLWFFLTPAITTLGAHTSDLSVVRHISSQLFNQLGQSFLRVFQW